VFVVATGLLRFSTMEIGDGPCGELRRTSSRKVLPGAPRIMCLTLSMDADLMSTPSISVSTSSTRT
jgi:hypothetical protein